MFFHLKTGISTVEIIPKQSKVTVTGYVEPSKVIRRLSFKTGKKVELWPYVPYEQVAHPYAPGAYDKKAPAGYVRNVMDNPNAAPLARASSLEQKYTSAFSDENPNACTVMWKDFLFTSVFLYDDTRLEKFRASIIFL
jgi:hypothetical protein